MKTPRVGAWFVLTLLVCSPTPSGAQDGEAFIRPRGQGPHARPEARRTRVPARRARVHAASIVRHAHAHGLEPALVYAVVEVESFFNARAISHAGARGLMQLMPVVELEYGVVDVFDPEQNLGAGCAYLAHLLRAYRGRLTWALAAYNAGPGRVARAGGPPSHVYVRRVLRARARWRTHLLQDAHTRLPGRDASTHNTTHADGARTQDE
jgi:soluble lytic murein transglycosylase-like protein